MILRFAAYFFCLTGFFLPWAEILLIRISAWEFLQGALTQTAFPRVAFSSVLGLILLGLFVCILEWRRRQPLPRVHVVIGFVGTLVIAGLLRFSSFEIGCLMLLGGMIVVLISSLIDLRRQMASVA
jgi:hypothetical protein